MCYIFDNGFLGKGEIMSYLFWIILPVAIWVIVWIVIDFMITENKGELEDIIKCKWGKDNEY
jgi:hypothetical protein